MLRRGHKSTTIKKMLEHEGLKASVRGISYFLDEMQKNWYAQYDLISTHWHSWLTKTITYHTIISTIARNPGSGRPSKITAEVKRIVDENMEEDDETTAVHWEQCYGADPFLAGHFVLAAIAS